MNPEAAGALIRIGPVAINGVIVTTWAVMLAMIAASLAVRSRLRLHPRKWQIVVEAIVVYIRDETEVILHRDPRPFLPLIATLGLFILVCNYASFIPAVSSPTASISTTAALALVVFLSVPYFGIRFLGVSRYLKGYITPTPIMLPFNIIGEISRTLALAVRLFGNIMSGQLIAAVILSLVPLFFPVVFHAIGLVTSLIQAYIFAILAAVYIGSALRQTEGGEGGSNE